MPDYLGWFTWGILLMLMELLVPGTYLIWFGFSALSVGALVFFLAPISLFQQMICFGLLSIVFALIGWRIYGRFIFNKRGQEDTRHLNDPIAQYVGKIVRVADVQDHKIHVSIGDTIWPATSDDQLKSGDNVLILGSDNNIVLNVKKYIDKNKKEE